MEARSDLRYREDMNTSANPRPVGTLLRDWRLRRRMSQLNLAADASISTRHLSFVESGRATPSRAMVLRLANRLDVPLRERNHLLLAAGFAPMYGERGLDDPEMGAARQAVELVLEGHEPYPALAVDRHWILVSLNRAAAKLMAGAAEDLLKAPVNVLRLSLHPDGLAPRILNLGAWRAHLFERLRRQLAVSADPVLAALVNELRSYPGPSEEERAPDQYVVVPLILATPEKTLSFISTTTVFGTPIDITLSELALETFFPADAVTADYLRHAVDKP
jgi:transcriptional regulator with XRE-family HTH domain